MYENLEINVNRLSYFEENNVVLKNINFTVRSGEILLLTGPNGSGKSTLLKIISGIVPNQEGQLVLVKNKKKDALHQYKHLIHYVTDQSILKDELDVYDQMLYWSYLGYFNLQIKLQYNRILTILNYFKLLFKFTYKIKYLSLGQKKRLSLCHLALTDNPIWLLDEPTLGLDTEGLKLLEQLILQHNTKNGIVIISSHVNIFLKHTNILQLGINMLA